MKIVMAVDPGLHQCGVCVLAWDGQMAKGYELHSAVLRGELVKAESAALRGPRAHAEMAKAIYEWYTHPPDSTYTDMPNYVVLEYPRAYSKGDAQKGDQNDLLDLSGVDGAIAAIFGGDVRHCAPSDWKGQVPKPIMVERIKRTLTPQEMKNLHLTGFKSKDHNTFDAVGIGLTFVGRMSKGWINRGEQGAGHVNRGRKRKEREAAPSHQDTEASAGGENERADQEEQ